MKTVLFIGPNDGLLYLTSEETHGTRTKYFSEELKPNDRGFFDLTKIYEAAERATKEVRLAFLLDQPK